MKRSFLLFFLITVAGLILIGRLFQLQVIKGADLDPNHNAAIKVIYDYPERGYIYDRNGELLVANQLSYDVMIVPDEVKQLDTLEFCTLLKIDKEYFKRKYKSAKRYSPWLPSVFLKQLAKEDFAFLQEKLHKFKGFYVQKRSIRNYPINSAANVLGYISEVNEFEAKNNPNFQQGELIGSSGVEKSYDSILRGIKGKKFLHRDRLNKIIGKYKEGSFDTLAVNGQDIALTIDSELQRYGELLMSGKRGGIVAIEPKTGEILALISTPTYNPNMMVGRQRAYNSTILMDKNNLDKPTFDRSLQASYPPGSPFKLINALIGLQEGVIDTNFGVYCYGGYRYGNKKNAFQKCHCDIFGGPIKLNSAISKSCNSYFSTTYRKIIDNAINPSEGMDIWSNHVKSFGLGNYLGYDLPVGSPGLIPTGKYYDNNYKFSWGATTTISNAIGQGEISTTPIQLANVTAAIANKGFYYTPHILKKANNKNIKNPKFTVPKKTTIASKYYDPIIEGMHTVFKTGTGKSSKIEGIDIVGKTGTAENFAIINGIRTQLEDHSILVAFAPKDDPKIAIAVFVENGGYGSTIAAPITSLLVEKYINRKIIGNNRKWIEKRMIGLSLEPIYRKKEQIKKLTFKD
ncbi:MAG: penicillin-binding protein 2 [Polaribacter sp.]|nr:penicillin-binding protein 2 [Polaribacter sp.]MDG1811315.1 penicillin-binding protein 2 [Polaribacter sp.]MDG1994507.1 penicillin-binding protein 2 [Polaribacter sp.]